MQKLKKQIMFNNFILGAILIVMIIFCWFNFEYSNSRNTLTVSTRYYLNQVHKTPENKMVKSIADKVHFNYFIRHQLEVKGKYNVTYQQLGLTKQQYTKIVSKYHKNKDKDFIDYGLNYNYESNLQGAKYLMEQGINLHYHRNNIEIVVIKNE